MNKIIKILIAVLGAVDKVFSVALPISFVLILITLYNISSFSMITVLLTGVFASCYRAIKLLIPMLEE